MEQVKTLFGFVMLVVPLILLERIIPWHVIMIIGSVLLLATGAYLYHWHTLTSNNKGKTALWLVAFVMVFSALTSISNQIWPTPKGQITAAASPTAPKQFINVANLDELNDQIQIASEQGKLVMLDLYADWCVACKEFEAYTFPDENVQAAFSNYVLLKADLTESNDITISFMEQFEVFGLPTILFFDRTGKELSDNRVTGFKNAEEFSAHLSSLASQY
jgi:thiol:disulfide interchange protein DsbD